MILRCLLRAWVWFCFVFLPAPLVVVAISSFSRTGYLQFPPRGFSFRWYAEFLHDPNWLAAIGISFVMALGVAAVTTCCCLLAAFARIRFHARNGFRLGAAFDLLMLAPLLFPHAAIAIALLGILAWLGCIATYPGLILAHGILCIPFAYRPILTALRKLDTAMEEAAMSLGAPPGYVLRHVTLPLLRPGLVAAFVFSFMISFDEVSVSLFLVGPGVTTLPVKVFAEIQESGSPTIAAVSTFLVLCTILLFVLIQKGIGMDLFLQTERSK